MNVDTVSWPIEFLELKKLDVILKCGICYDYMNTSMMTTCSHNYCSLCIRKFMQYKTQCPTCFEETYEVGLRNNRPLDEIILIYTQIKDRLLRTLRLAAVTLSGSSSENLPLENFSTFASTPKNISEKKSFFSSSAKSLTSSARNSKNPKISCELFPPDPTISKLSNANDSGPDTEMKLSNAIKVPQMFHSPKGNCTQPKQGKPKEMAHCPVCQVEVPQKNINLHLDACLARSAPEVKLLPKPKPRRDPLPKRLYSLMGDKDLKKNLKEYGLNTQGDRKVLINRLQRYTVLYNSENDSLKPRSASEIVLQVEREEREEKKSNSLFKAFQAKMNIDRKAPPEVIEKVNKDYLEENKYSFQKLIENMKAREGCNIKPLKPSPRVESDEEVDIVQVIDPSRPSTSQECLKSLSNKESEEKESVYSQETIQEVDTDFEDDDIFEVKCVEQKKKGQIDWNRTIIQKENLKTPKLIRESAKENNINDLSVLILDQEDSEVYESVFPNAELNADCEHQRLESGIFDHESNSSDSSFFSETLSKSMEGNSSRQKKHTMGSKDKELNYYPDEEVCQPLSSLGSSFPSEEANSKQKNPSGGTKLSESELKEEENEIIPENSDSKIEGRRRSKRKIAMKENVPSNQEEVSLTRKCPKRVKT